ncbi:P-loop containing nucleoside triphosphate hydrolase protein [Zopfochytrium polystomum]|nr:P-loop containing nucleoside triphosphate hydrolase protein [Zopfochytrium polystomum]
MIAIMGSSGAGKTTLLNCLSGRLTTGILSGSITHNGQPRDAHTWKKVMAYVEQDDALFSELTVRETIDFAAQLRLPAALTREEKSKHGDGLVKVLRLAGAANTKIGGGQSNARGVSGGERKRTAIAQELVGGPEILFLDEPTSGLDSNSSLSVLETVKHDAESTGRIVIATIHQPSWELLCLFDKVLLLAGGSTVYYGPPEAAITHFSGVGFTCKATQNPADYFLDLLTIDPSKSPESMEEDQKRVKMLQEYAKASSMPGDIEADGAAAPGALTRQNTFPSGGGVGGAEVQRTLTRRSTIPHLYINDNSAGGSSNPWLFELRMTLGRSFQQFFRNRLVMALFFVRAVFLTVLVSFSFYRMEAWRDTATAQTLTDLSGFLYFWPVMLTYMTVLPIAGVFPMEREIIKRERAAGAYRTSSYFFGRCIVEIVVHSLFGILFMTTVAYFVVGLRTDGGGARFFAFLLIQWVGLVGSVGIGLVIGAAAKTVEMGQVVGPVAVITSLLYGGGLLNSADLIYPLKAFEWISPASYVYRASMQNELRGLVYASCNATSASVATAASIQCFRTGEDALAYYAVDDLSFWTCIGVGFALACAYMVLGYAILRTYGRAKTKII